MASRTATLWLCICLCLWLAAGCAKAPGKGHQRLKRGDKAPEFVLRDITGGGEDVSSSRVFLSNSATVVIIWSMACPTCREALIDCERVYQQYGTKAMGFYGINFDTENIQGVRAFLKAEGVTFTNLWDPRFRATRAYRALDYTFSVFVVDQNSNLVLVQYDHPPDLADILSKALDEILTREFKNRAK